MAHVGLGALGTLGTAPRAAFGVTLHGGVRRGALSIALEGRADLPAAKRTASGGTVSSALLLGTLAPCFHRSMIVGCALVSAGALAGSSEGVTRPAQVTTPFAALGARIGVEVPLVSELSARIHADLLGGLTRTTLELDGLPVWTTPPISGALGAGLAWSFP